MKTVCYPMIKNPAIIYMSKSAPIALIATCFALVNPLIGCFFLLYALYSRRRFSLLFSIPIGLVFGSIGYNLYVKSEPDLLRYFQMVRDMKGMTFSSVLSKNTSMLYVQDALFYLVSRTNDVYLLSFIIGWLVYTVVFLVYFDFIERIGYFKRWRKQKSLYFLLAIISAIAIRSPFFIINNVRCVSAYVFITYAAYRELVQEKRDTITFLFYIVPCFLHTTAVIMIGFRLVLILSSRAGRRKYFFFFALIFVFPVALEIAVSVLQNTPIPLVQSMADKALFYNEWTSGYAAEVADSRRYWFERIYGVFFLSVGGVLHYFKSLQPNLVKRFAPSPKKERGIRLFTEYLLLIALAALCCLWIKMDVFWRFEACFCLYSPVIFLGAIQCELDNKSRIPRVTKCLLFSGAMMLLPAWILFQRFIYMDLFFKGFATTCPAWLFVKLAAAFIHPI